MKEKPIKHESLNAGFTSFFKASYPDGTPFQQGRQVKAAFGAGVLVMFNAITVHMPEEEEAALAYIKNLHEQVGAFSQLISKEAVASCDDRGKLDRFYG